MKRPGFKEIDWQRVAVLTLKVYSSLFGFGSIATLTGEITKTALLLSQSRSTLSEKVKQTTTALRDASMLVSELEAELTSQLEKVEALKADYEKYAQLASTEEEKAQAIMAALKDTISASQGQERIIAFGINIAAGILIFVGGLVASPHVIKWLHLK